MEKCSEKTILFVVGTLEVGGTERHLSLVAAGLVRRGWTVSIYSLAGDGPLRETIASHGVTVIVAPIDRDGRPSSFAYRLFRFLVTACHLFGVVLFRRPRVVHCFLPAAYITAAPLAILAGIRIRLMSRRSLNRYQAKSPLLAGVERRLHRFMSAILGNSLSVARELLEEGVPRDRLALIYNGIDSAQFGPQGSRDEMRDALGLPGTALVLIIVANLIPYKGHLDLVEALARVSSSMPEWRLLIVGRDDGVGGQLRARSLEAGIAERLLFLGARNDVAELLRASDIGLLVSHEEGFSNAIIEGMFAGLPMIVTNVGGNTEAVADGVTGLVVPPGAPQALSGAIIQLAKDSSLRTRYGEAGRVRAETRFTLEACLGRYERLYSGLLAGESVGDMEELRIQ